MKNRQKKCTLELEKEVWKKKGGGTGEGMEEREEEREGRRNGGMIEYPQGRGRHFYY